jgi:hypothetical protein
MRKFLVLFSVLIVFVFAGCGESPSSKASKAATVKDGEVAKKLIGTWVFERRNNGEFHDSWLIFEPNGILLSALGDHWRLEQSGRFLEMKGFCFGTQGASITFIDGNALKLVPIEAGNSEGFILVKRAPATESEKLRMHYIYKYRKWTQIAQNLAVIEKCKDDLQQSPPRGINARNGQIVTVNQMLRVMNNSTIEKWKEEMSIDGILPEVGVIGSPAYYLMLPGKITADVTEKEREKIQEEAKRVLQLDK